MLILASASPRRKELLALAGYEFSVIPSDFDESSILESDPYVLVEALSTQKAKSIAKDHPNDTVLAADTVVILEQTILGKPKDDEDAFNMLHDLIKQQQHVVATGVCIIHQGKIQSFVDKTIVYFNPLTDEEIRAYVQTKEPMDKAGAYGIQGKGALFIDKINGDYYNVMGLPIAKVHQALKKLVQM